MHIAKPESKLKPRRLLGLSQAVIAIGAVGGLLLAPPAFGQLAFYPISPAADRALPGIVFQDGRRAVARTALGGGYVMQGARPPLSELLFEHGILVLAVPQGGCTGAISGT